MTFYEEIVAAVDGQSVEAIIVGRMGFYNYDNEPNPLFNIPLQLCDVKELLDYKYDSGFGGAECHPVYIYTFEYIYFISEYDGSTVLTKIPRSPRNTSPDYF